MSSAPTFRDLTGLTAILESCLVAYLIVSLIGIWSGWGEFQLLQGALAGAETTEAEADASDARQALVGGLVLLALIVTGVVFLRWIVLANRNARALGASGLRFTPGWSAGWYFVPVAWLWKPYQAMKELFKASHPDFTDDWANAPRPGILPVWWTLWILSNYVGNIALNSMVEANTLEHLASKSLVNLLSHALDVPLGIAVLMVVSQLNALQTEKHARLSVVAPDRVRPEQGLEPVR